MSAVEAFYWYDGDGAMVKSKINSVVTYFAGRHYHKEINQGSETIRKFYTAGSAQVAMRTNGVLTWVLSDHLGSSTITTDESGARTDEILRGSLVRPFPTRRWILPRPARHSKPGTNSGLQVTVIGFLRRGCGVK